MSLVDFFRLVNCTISMLPQKSSVNFWRTSMVTMLEHFCLKHCLIVTKNFKNCWIWIKAFYLLIPMAKKSSSILRSELDTFPFSLETFTMYSQKSAPPWLFASEGINYYYVSHKSGEGLFAYPKGRPRKDADCAKGGIPIPSSDDIETRILKIQRDKQIAESAEWMVLLSFATNQMMRYMSMYPKVWFMDCTAGMYELYEKWILHIQIIQFLLSDLYNSY